jgi:A1 cistron-splicing factor AAR2
MLEAPKDLKDAESKLPIMHEETSSTIQFTKVNNIKSNSSNPSEITKHSIDLSNKLESFIGEQQRTKCCSDANNKEAENDNVLGELQFAFVCFLIGNSYDAFEQWKLMVNLLCNSETAIRSRPGLFLNFLNALYFQLNEMPADFFTDITTAENFLVFNLHNLFDNVSDVCGRISGEEEDETIIDKLRRKSDQFKNYLQQKFNFDFEQEPDEYAPVICDDNDVL